MSENNIAVRMNKLGEKLEKMNSYDYEGFVTQLEYWIGQMDFYYNTLCKDKDPVNIFYKVKPAQRPSEGQIAYFNLTRGFPKELYDGHFCYILKDHGYKFTVIPITSLKDDSSECDPEFQLDIDFKIGEIEKGRLQCTDLRTVDLQRINTRKGIYDVITPKTDILNKIKEVIFS
jgi:hypothetical protein